MPNSKAARSTLERPEATRGISSVEPRDKIPGISENEPPPVESQQSDSPGDGGPSSIFLHFSRWFLQNRSGYLKNPAGLRRGLGDVVQKAPISVLEGRILSAYFSFPPSERMYFRTAAICCWLSLSLKETMAVPLTPFSIASFRSVSGWAACHLGSVKSGVLMAA